MSSTAVLTCHGCHQTRPVESPAVRCPCGGLLDLELAPDLGGAELRTIFDARLGATDPLARSGVWRFRELVLPQPSHHPISAPEGNTPLIVAPPVAEWVGIGDLALKHEGMNPTGSFKDRGMTVGITQALGGGNRWVACASTGNTAASLASYAARAGIRALVLMPAGMVAPGKLSQALAYGATVVEIRGDFDRCLRLVEQAARELGVYLLNSINPFRIAGQQSIVYEMLQQRRWAVPDWIVLPAGNLGNTAAFGAALRLAARQGLIDRLPRLAAVQAEGAAPFAASFRTGFSPLRPVTAKTVATAIQIGDPASFDRAVRAIRDTDGVVTAVSDGEIIEAKRVVDRAGVGCEPASAAAVAGARRLRREGVMNSSETVVAVLTGHLLKDPAPPGRAAEPVAIDGTVDEIAQLLERGGA